MTRLRRDHLERPHPPRFDALRDDHDAVLAAHRAAVQHGQISYRDPTTGYSVFTAAYLAQRGTCCDNGCRHCPYAGADAD